MLLNPVLAIIPRACKKGWWGFLLSSAQGTLKEARRQGIGLVGQKQEDHDKAKSK
jgi:hypothetical protein